MSSTPPFIEQERPESCAVACLRMILAHRGSVRSEAELLEVAAMEEAGLDPRGLAELARECGLQAVERQLSRRALFALIRRQRFPIVFLYRRLLDKVGEGHAVVCLRLSRKFVTFLDPLRGERRVTIQRFEEARRLIGRWVVVWT
jgi:ABC-type bacteriocin/lantibiotic exporter with double-glycine peptidase domain